MYLTSAVGVIAFAGAVDAGLFNRQAMTASSGSSSSSTSSGSRNSTSTATPDYFITKPELNPGPTPTGSPAFLAQTNPAPFATVSFIPISPLETQVPITGNTNNSNIFQLMGQLSHYFPAPGFGVDEYPLPAGANISYLHMLSRHGSRYPTSGSGAPSLGAKIANATGKFNATGDLSFLNTWTYKLGAEILTPVGRQELFDSGVLHAYQYGHLYPNNGSKIIARTTTQDRMLKSAENFMAGFFGLEWVNNATLELIWEQSGFNNSLAGYFDCPNNNVANLSLGNAAATTWSNIYLKNTTDRLSKLITGFNWTITDSYNGQSLCAYETVALGYSAWCDLYTYDDWLGYEYSVDINFAGNVGFASPTGRAVGIGYVQELLARIQHHTINSAMGSINYTLDNNTTTFPLYQKLNFDFSHDTNIFAILTAMGITQFRPFLNATSITPTDAVVSHITPFGARLDIEIIDAPRPVAANRTRGGSASGVYTSDSGNTTQYIHFILNQRTLPLGKSFSACGNRTDGWCELKTFLQVQQGMYNTSQYDYACFGKYPSTPTYGQITNGVPISS